VERNASMFVNTNCQMEICVAMKLPVITTYGNRKIRWDTNDKSVRTMSL
jgi:hypothetical protein